MAVFPAASGNFLPDTWRDLMANPVSSVYCAYTCGLYCYISSCNNYVMCVCMSVCMHAPVCVFVCMHLSVYVCTHACMSVSYVCVFTCVYKREYVTSV